MKRPVLVAAAIVVGCALLGVLCGVGWWLWWKPGPTGVVFEKHPYFMPDAEFRSTGLYVAVAAPAGLVVGVLTSVLLRRAPLLAVVLAVLGATAGGAVMLLTGWLLGPESALALARHAKDGATAQAALRVQPGVAWCVMPIATAIGCLGVLLSTDVHTPGEMVRERS